MDTLGIAGLIFIRNKDVCVEIICKILSIEFNLIGIYYKKDNHYYFKIIDILGIYFPNYISYFRDKELFNLFYLF